jgi:hypothetical protein
MNQLDPSKLEIEVVRLPRWVLVPIGVLLGLFTMLCLMGSVTLIISPNEKAPVLALVVGVVWVVACCWVLEKCYRLITGKKNNGGLMSPNTLRSIGWLFLFLPVGGLFTGYFVSHTFFALVQTAADISIFFGLRRLAAIRETHRGEPFSNV